MTSRTRVVVATLWILSLFAVDQLTRAQGDPMTLQQPVLYTGSDIGVRVTQPKGGGSNLATIVVRVAGRWQEVEIRPANSR